MHKKDFIIVNRFDENANSNIKSTLETAFKLYYK